MLLLRDAQGNNYLNAAGNWYTAQALDGTWLVLSQPPKVLLSAQQAAEKAGPVDALLPKNGKKPGKAPAVRVATQPTELIVSDGTAQMAPVDGVSLLSLNNADHAVFVDPTHNTWYVLVSGRWFSGPGEKGPWTYVPGKDLPADFAKISAKDPKANVLVSVPGTPQAKEAAIAASIPQTASVSRSKATLKVTYDGAPNFQSITGTSLNYAVNTPTPVIEVTANQFFAVSNGVWFTAPSPSGPWQVATEVPAAIYGIPPSSPVYYVTYVHIYSVTPQTVVVGYTPGYLGVVVNSDGTVVYGTGYAYPAYVSSTVYYGYPPTYGYGAGFAVGALTGFAFGYAAGAWWARRSPTGARTGDLIHRAAGVIPTSTRPTSTGAGARAPSPTPMATTPGPAPSGRAARRPATTRAPAPVSPVARARRSTPIPTREWPGGAGPIPMLPPVSPPQGAVAWPTMPIAATSRPASRA